ncbi:hypothetical protein Trydic_g7986 [Trypoxylus dichotomus]
MCSSQANTIICLQDHFSQIEGECRKELIKLTEIQADNIKLDRQLYLSCADEQMHYCRQFPPGSGKVFKCLMQHYDEHLTDKCRNHLLRRQRMISEDYRISKGLMRACKEDIKRAHCRRQTSDDKSIRLAQVLLCLENIMKNGTRVDSECEAEMRDHRKILMEDYRVSPEIVDGCSLDIKRFCSDLEVGGKTLHCLMEHARGKNSKKRIRDTCMRALEQVIKESDAAEDWRVDPVLYEACFPVVKIACKGLAGGDARIMTCLMDNIGEEVMIEECEDALIQIQYFVARDFKLDTQLFRACKEDAKAMCNADSDWENPNKQNPEKDPLVLPCLYRNAFHEDAELKLKPRCFEQIKRVMRQRALSVDLNPKIEEDCLPDLAMSCFDKTAKGEELLCLQSNLDKLQTQCKTSIINYTEAEAEHIELNPYIMRNCKEIMETVCRNELDNEHGDVMNCLISHKNDIVLISLKDIRFSYKFKIACKPYAIRFCQNERTKAGVVSCLSEKVVNDTMQGIRSDIQRECRQQLKAQLFQQRESVDYDIKLAKACENDIRKYCSNIPHGSAQVLECLQTTTNELSDSCQIELFKIKKEEITDNSVDYALITMCADTIEQFCPKYEKEHVLDCLKKHKDETGFNKKCRLVVVHRIVEQNSDYRLNPSLQENCKLDIRKFCGDIISEEKPDKELNGKVIKCLRKSFRQSRLTNKCEKEMVGILRERALDLRLNPLLRAVCKDELETICKIESEEDDGKAEECLKAAFLNRRIPTVACQEEVANLIEESQADINTDPFLQQACALDILKYCSDIPQGSGRHIKCLRLVMTDKSKDLSPECTSMFKKRIEMYRNADALIAPESLQQLYTQVVGSPVKHYFFFVILMVIGTIFVIGIFCGRVSRRHMLIKNK